MKIGVVGLGKVGLVLAQLLRHHGGHEVVGYDVRSADAIYDDLDTQREPTPKGALTIAHDVRTVVLASDVVYICVPTPEKSNEGADGYDADFDYTHLIDAVTAVSQEASKQQKHVTMVILSTVAPGTFLERIYDAVGAVQYVALVYSPSFISLGTVWRDMEHPTAILIGAETQKSADLVDEVWRPIVSSDNAPRLVVSIESAEIIKMASNALQYMKISFINSLGELAEKTGANIDEVSDSLGEILNHGWIPRAGMPDGGPCRPRDVAAMWSIANKYGLSSVELLASFVDIRDYQFGHIGGQVAKLAYRFPDLPILILGDSYKPGVTYTDSAPGPEVAADLAIRGFKDRVSLVPGNFTEDSKFHDRAIYVIAVPFKVNLLWVPSGSIVYDVWGMHKDDVDLDVTYIAPGRGHGF